LVASLRPGGGNDWGMQEDEDREVRDKRALAGAASVHKHDEGRDKLFNRFLLSARPSPSSLKRRGTGIEVPVCG
jgi:hypothetical protein